METNLAKHVTLSKPDDFGKLLQDEGIICVDDFFSFRYPQITAATYSFLRERRPEFQMLFAGSNKGYICRSRMFGRYDEVIRRGFLPAIARNNLDVQLNRPSPPDDDGCFTISWREGDRVLIGLDEDLDKIPK